MRVRPALSWAVVLVACHRTSAETPAVAPASPPATTTAAPAPAAPPPAVDAAAPLTGPRLVIHTASGSSPVVRVEVADTEATRERGLMYRRAMDEDAGMIFLFARDEHLTFWMHNTYLPLDMLFIAADHTVRGIVRNATPMTDDLREVPGTSKYVLEVRGGYASRHGVNAGDRVDFVDVPTVARE